MKKIEAYNLVIIIHAAEGYNAKVSLLIRGGLK